jgi:hypothetical protein
MPRVLTYVDAPVARQIATSLVGSEVQLSENKNATVGINFKVLLTHASGATRTTTTKVSDLLPEVVADAIYEATQHRLTDLADSRNKLIAGNAGAFSPGTPILLQNGILLSEGRDMGAVLSEEECMGFRVGIGSFFVNAYCPRSAAPIVESLVNQPIEAMGVLRYTPPYSAGGALSLTLGLRVCAIWLR